MRSARLSFALNSGAISLPDTGDILVLRPRAEDDLSDLPQDRVIVVTGFKPDYDAFAARGYRVATTVSPASAAVVCLPRSKAEARGLVAAVAGAVSPGGPILVDGQKTDGVDPMWRDLKALVAVGEPLAKAHGRIFSFPAGPELAAWAAVPSIVEGGFQTVPGVFSADAPDKGSALLAAALPAYFPGYIVDLGAGWGFLARAILERKGVKRVDLVEAEFAALDCARVNITDPRARFFWADAATYRADGYADAVVCNPPFHAGRDADPALGASFLAAAARMLSPNGSLWLVANGHLPYDRVLATLFRDVTPVGGDGTFRLTHARHPIKPRHS